MILGSRSRLTAAVRQAHLGLLAGWAAAVVGGCQLFSPLPDLRTAVDRAHEIEPRCNGFADESTAPLLSQEALDSVEPAYSYVASGPVDRQARLRGARIRVRPLAGLSRESLTRVVECHQARVVLGLTRAVTDDPYVLPGRWLDLDVDSAGDGFVVLARIDGFADAHEVLARARRFATPHTAK